MKPGIVAYTISKLISLVPRGYCIDFNTIWRKQELYPSLNAELERLAHATFDYIQALGGNGMEQCKKEETWKNYKSKSYKLSEKFLSDLLSSEVIESQLRAETKDNQLAAKLDIESEIIKLGGSYWRNLIQEGITRRLLSQTEIDLLKIAASIDTPYPRIASPKQAQWIWKIRKKLEDAGVLV